MKIFTFSWIRVKKDANPFNIFFQLFIFLFFLILFFPFFIISLFVIFISSSFTCWGVRGQKKMFFLPLCRKLILLVSPSCKACLSIVVVDQSRYVQFPSIVHHKWLLHHISQWHWHTYLVFIYYNPFIINPLKFVRFRRGLIVKHNLFTKLEL